MKNTRAKSICFVAFVILSLAIVCPALSAPFCVSTASELSTALLTATNNGEDDIIKVQQGTYNGNFIYASTEAFGVTMEGGYTSGCLSRVIDATNTVLDAENDGPALVLSAPNLAVDFVVGGLTLQNGNVNIQGGGLYAGTNGAITLTNNTIKNNNAFHGGGISFDSPSGAVTLVNNTIINNNANGNNGGVFIISNSGAVTLTNNTISNNSAQGGAGGINIKSPFGNITLTNNTISNNSAQSGAGGINYDSTSGTLTFINNTISNNQTNGSGGGFYINSSVSGTFTLVNNTINDNSTQNNAGGIYFYSPSGSITLANNTINNNYANDSGGGIWLRLNFDNAISNIYNNIIWNNSAGIEGGDLYIDNDNNHNYIPSTVNLFNNDFDQSLLGTYIEIPFPIDPSNLNGIDPLFVDSDNDDYHLTADSPLIDKGNNSAPELPAKDKDGKPRIIDGDYDGISYVDIGAYEFGSPRGDLDGDGDVDGEDLRIFAESYGTYVGP